MIVKCFAIVDRVTGVFDGPHKAMNEGQFMRSFKDVCTKGEIANHPEDFYAVEIGTYDDATGVMVGAEDGPRRIADAADLVMGDKENIDA